MVSVPVSAEVVVVGFGPVGAALAGLLGNRGISVLVLERDEDVFPLPRAAHVDHTGLRTWQELGVLDELLPDMQPNSGLDFVTADGGVLLSVPGDQSSASGLPASMYFHQPGVDRAIRREVSALPSVEVLLGVDVRHVGVVDGRAVLDVVDSGGNGFQIQAPWAVGCDGAWSVVRESSQLALDDLQYEEPWLVVDVILPESSTGILQDRAICRCDPNRPTYSIPMPADRHRFEFRLMNGESADEMLQTGRTLELLAPWLNGEAVRIERSAVYTFHGLVAPDWRNGPVLLAGDAAHQMPPFLGQGMCSGLRDASNLAWKLQHVLRRGAPTGLLDTYTDERRDHVREIVESAVAFGRIISVVDPAEAEVRDREILGDVAPATERMAFALPTLAAGPLVLEGGGELFIQPPGVRGQRLDDVAGPRFAVYGRSTQDIQGEAAWWTDEVGATVAALDDLGDFAAPIDKWLTARDARVVVIRPDRYVMWAGNDLGAATRAVMDLLAGRTESLVSSQAGNPNAAKEQ